MFFYLATVHFQSCTLNVNKIDVVQRFRKLICVFSLTCFKVSMCKISDESATFSLNYSNLFRGPLFFGTQCRYITYEVTLTSSDHYKNSSVIVDLAMRQILRSTERISS